METALNSNSPILSIQNITVRHTDDTLFTGLSFDIKNGEQWALVGESGSGKSALLQTIAGKFNVTGGVVNHYFYDDFIAFHQIDDPLFTWHKLIAMVSGKHHFRNLSNTGEFYYQQRFNAIDSEDAPTVSEYLLAIHPETHTRQIWSFEQTIQKLKLVDLLDKQLIKLSNGETKRLLIAASLLKHPAILLLDNPLMGLDVQTRIEFNEILNEITATGIHIVMATSPNEIPDCITHVAILNERKIVSATPKKEFDASLVKLPEVKKVDLTELNALLTVNPPYQYTDIVKMNKVRVKYGKKVILENIDWHIRPGEHWALVGHNGSGKSTLLSLINGDNPQAYSNDMILFDRKRGTGESIWDIKSKTGFVSPELLQYFPTDNNCLQVIESGFYDTLGLFRPSQPPKREIAMRWMRLLEMESEANKLFKNISASKQRLCLLARALVKNPPLLIFDEPCQGLDARQQQHFKQLVDAICKLSSTTLIYVSHYQHEIPDSVNFVLKLEKGRAVF